VSDSNQTQKQVIYRETVWASWLSTLPVVLIAPSLAFVVIPFTDFVIATLIGSSALVVCLVVVLALAPKIVVVQEDREILLQVNAARIRTSHISSVEIISKSEVRAERGPKLDARSFRVFQPSVPQMIKIHLQDENDPTPYWLVSTRNPSALKAALRK